MPISRISMALARGLSASFAGWSRRSCPTGLRLSLMVVVAAVTCLVASWSLVFSADHSGLTGRASAALILLGVALLIVAGQITRRVQKRRHEVEALWESEQYFRTLLDHVPAAV